MIQLLLIAFFIGFGAASKYCDSKLCSNGQQHIGCGNTGHFYPKCPEDRHLLNITQTEIDQILNQHNTLRSRIASGDEAGFSSATRMATMTWNTELANLCTLNVKQCKMHHDACHNTKEFKYAGQNLAYRANSGAFEQAENLIEKVVNDWYGEVKNAAQSDIEKCCKSSSGKTVGHFTQVVTDRAIQVGCAVAQYTEKQWKTSLMCCNYALTNMIDSAVYVSGDTAAGCTEGTNPDYPGLCSADEPIKAEL